MNVRDVMTTDVCTVGPDTPLKDVARLLVDRGVSGVPVVDAESRVLGIVSEGDFLQREAGTLDRPRGTLWWFWAAGTERDQTVRSHATTAGAAMSSPAITIGPDRSLAQAATTMARADVNRLPVVADHRLVGIISRADIVRAYARGDDELTEVVRTSLRAVDGLTVVEVRDGVAVLAGTVAHQSIAVAIRGIVEGIDGILGVDDRAVAWSPEPERIESWLEGTAPGLGGDGRQTD